MITKTYMIPEENIENLEKKFNAAARKIHKINPALEPTMTKGDHTIVLIRKIEVIPSDCRTSSSVKKVPYEAREIVINIPDGAVFAEIRKFGKNKPPKVLFTEKRKVQSIEAKHLKV